MPNVVSSVRITPEAHRLVGRLATKLGTSRAQVIERALQKFEEEVFWRDVHKAFETLEADPKAHKEYRKQHSAWDKTLNDGLGKDKW